MGITGLLPLLKKASGSCNIRKFSGCTVAIDAYCWLHKGAFGCAAQLGKGEQTTAYISYCVKYINVLLSHNIRPIVVLDGQNLPSKAGTEKKRREKREENRKNAKEFLRKGMNKEAWECFTRCVDITPAMARAFIKVLRDMKIDYIVAPYEADAQLAYLAMKNIVDIVITEDSDLVLFGCPKIFFKMNITGDGVLFDQAKLPTCFGMKPEEFCFEKFRWMCILSGCDYLPSLPGIGLGRAKKLMDAATSLDIHNILQLIPRILRIEVDVTDEYIQGFLQADKTFLYQLIFDTMNRCLTPLNPYPADVNPDDLHFAGAYVDTEMALNMALGNVDIHSFKTVDNFDPISRKAYGHKSIWSPNYVIPTEVKVVAARNVKPKTQPTCSKSAFANVSVGVVLNKKKIQVESNNSEMDDEQLLAMYAGAKINDAPDSIEICSQTELTFQESKSFKRKRGSLSQTSSPDTDVVGHDENAEQPSKRLSLRSRNPFLKVDKKPTPQPHSNPICLIEKNKVYKDDKETMTIVVKSQYFKGLEDSTKTTTFKKCTEFNTVRTVRTEMKCEILDETNNVQKSDALLNLVSETRNESRDSQVSIYSVENDHPDMIEGMENSQDNDSVITIDDDDESSAVIPNGKFTRLSNSFAKSPPKKRVISPRRSPRKKLGPCRGAGMSKTALKIKQDSKQQKISSMFAYKPRPKL
ncbi:exonuclease 1 isoform X2 [Folsomia candida]|uniref:exonuclease 1 isoform X2 n=1 Tax=Folsomia candida TaxID=158441 RepID=UPI000B8F0560|nr:exonuclease 1 isoform X2 [Folsomia candida]